MERLLGVSSATGEKSIWARYVVGRSGMNSLVRKSAGIGFEGAASHGDHFILADVEMEWPLESREVSLFFSAAGLVVIAPLPGGSFRVVATWTMRRKCPAGRISSSFWTRVADESAGQPWNTCCGAPASGFIIAWRTRTPSSGPFLLMGDAAHVVRPAGGQGMNTGLVDAVALGAALVRVLLDGAPDSELDHYATMRRPAAGRVLALAGHLTRMATIKSVPLRLMRNLVLRALNRLRPFRMKMALALSGISRRKLSGIEAVAAPAIEQPAVNSLRDFRKAA